MTEMFCNTIAFNQWLHAWDIRNVTNMSRMFVNACSFQQSLTSWDVENVANKFGMFYGPTAINREEIEEDWHLHSDD